MDLKLKIETANVADLVPYAGNAKKHPDWQVRQIANSIEQFGNCDPIAIWHKADGQPEIVEGHGRLLALKMLGIETCPTIALDHLDDDERRAYAHAHNQLTMNTDFDMDLLEAEIEKLNQFDWKSLGFKVKDGWFEYRERFDTSKEDGNDEYNEFLEKFENKKTTDDCYTPDEIYEAVADFVEQHYGVARSDMVRPFYPGGDYENDNYQDGCCVVDNPPFSILAQIIRFYNERGIRFFLFAPALTLFSSSSSSSCAIPLNVRVDYENGANVATSFVTNLEEAAIHTMPELYELIDEANKAIIAERRASFPKYEYPDEVITASRGGYLSKYGQELVFSKEDVHRISCLDMQKENGQPGIFGSGYLLSDKAAAEKAAADKAAADKAATQRFTLSEREWEIVKSLGGGAHDR